MREQPRCRTCELKFNPETSGRPNFCSHRCEEKDKLKRASQVAEWRGNFCEKKHKGAWAELMACQWLLSRRFDVFKNTSHFGPVDVIGIRDGEVRLFDVKYIRMAPRTGGDRHEKVAKALSKPQLTRDQKKLGVELLYVTWEGVCGFTIDGIQSRYREIYGKAFDICTK